MRKKSVYLETSFISYLTSRPSRDIVAAGRQTLTHEWWETQRDQFTLYISELVVSEAKQGNPEAATERLAILANLDLLHITEAISGLAHKLIENHAIPEVAIADAVHVSIAAANGIDYLLTWNCKHIANAHCMEMIYQTCLMNDYKPPLIVTPEAFLGDNE